MDQHHDTTQPEVQDTTPAPTPPVSDVVESAERKPNFVEDRPAVVPLDESAPAAEDFEKLALLMDEPKIVMGNLTGLKNKQIPGTKEHVKEYSDTIREALPAHINAGSDLDPFRRPNAEWHQGVKHNGETLSAGRPRYRSTPNQSLSGDAALLRARAASGLGTVLNVPLWHTGIWLKLKAPRSSTMLELQRRITMSKIDLGRSSVGVGLSNTAVYLTTHVIDAVLRQVYDGTVKDLSPQGLKELIRVTDIQQLIWGLAAVRWPNGYTLVRPCVSNPTKCSHIDRALIKFGPLSRVDNRSLSTAQRNHMANRDGTMTAEALELYRNEHVAPQTHLHKVNDDMSVLFEVPTIAAYERAGHRWIDGIVTSLDEAFGQEIRGEERNDYISEQSAMTNLRRYAHWIKEIHFADGSVIDNVESVEAVLDDQSSDKLVRESIVAGVEKFIANATICAIGLAKYTCPACGNDIDETDILPRLPEIMPLEMAEVFFTLLYTEVAKTLQSN